MCLHEAVNIEWGWLVLVAAGALVLLLSVIRYSRTHPTTPFAFLRRQPDEDGVTFALRAAGTVAALFGTLMFGYASASPWIAVAILVAADLPSLAARLIHNRTVRSRAALPREPAHPDEDRSARNAND